MADTDNMPDAMDALTLELATRTTERDALAARVTELEEENTHLRRSVAGHKGMSKRLRNQVEVLEARVPKELREFELPELPADPSDRADLLELIDAAETVELAFVDVDGRELGIAPREIVGGAAAWQTGVNGLRLAVGSLQVTGPEPGAPAYPLGGYALVLDGELVARQVRPQISIGAGMTHELKEDVLF